MNNVTHLKHERGVEYFESTIEPFLKHISENPTRIYYQANDVVDMLPVDREILCLGTTRFGKVTFKHYYDFIIITGFSQ